MLDIINEKKELFEGKIKKDILKKLWKKFQWKWINNIRLTNYK
jgi:hypothetical protein